MLNSEWKEFRLGEILAERGYIRGPFGSALKRGEMREKGIPVYEQQHAIYDHREFRYHVSEEKFEKMKRFSVQTNDLIISCSGTIGRVSIIREKDPVGIISQALLILRANTSIITPDFLYYYFSSHYGFYALTSVSSGSVQVNVANRKIIENTKIMLPSISEQNEITKKLQAIDDMVSKNRHLITNIEQILSSLFRSWFIDFDPVKAKSEGKLPYGMNEETAALFPDSFEDSELGRIPSGWSVKGLGDVCSIIKGLSYKGEFIHKPGPALLGIGTIREGGGFRPENVRSYGGPHKERQVLKPGDTYTALTSQDGLLLGSTARIPDYFEGTGIATHHVGKVECNELHMSEFLYSLMQTQIFIRHCINFSVGTTVYATSPKDVERLRIVIPTPSVLKRFFQVSKSFGDLTSRLEIELFTLKVTRDALLPRLMSGELWVS